MKKKLFKLLPILLITILCLSACGSDNRSPEVIDQSGQQASDTNQTNNATAETPESISTENAPSIEATAEPTAIPLPPLAPDKPIVALTFDDGPNLDTTPKVLDILEKYEVTASFFLIGNNINVNNMKVVKRAYDMGCEINNHSQSHSYMNKMTAEEIQKEVETTSKMVETITGEPTKFFRPPFISVSDTMYENIDMPFICGVGCNDWDNNVTVDERIENTLNQVSDGTIILLHDSSGNTKTVEALDTIIPQLLEDGYQFATLSQLFTAKGIEISTEDTKLYTIVK